MTLSAHFGKTLRVYGHKSSLENKLDSLVFHFDSMSKISDQGLDIRSHSSLHKFDLKKDVLLND